MLRGQPKYLHLASDASYHKVADPIIKPIRGVNFRQPKTFLPTKQEVRQLGPLLRSFHPVVPDNGYYNTIAAFRKRCNYFSAKRADPQITSAAVDLVKIICPDRLRPFDWNKDLYDAWILKFGEEKKQRMEAALLTLPSADLRDYADKDIFVKVECLLVGHKPNWAPRVIYKGTDLYNAISGPIFCELMDRFDRCLMRMTGKYQFRTAYKKTALDYVPFLEREDPQENWIEADFSSNDKLQCSDVMLLEVALMRELGCPEWFVRLHLKTNTFSVKSSHGIRARLKNQLPTGATDTTFRNCFWNSVILFAFLRRVKARKCRAVLLGDDMLARVLGLPRYACKTYKSIASLARMEAEVFRHDCLFKATFLSKFFIPRSDGCHLTVPILGKALARFNMRANNNQAVSDHAYMAGKSVGYAYEFRFVPQIRDIFLKRFLHEFSNVANSERDAARHEVELNWNARAAGVTLKNIRKKMVESETVHDADLVAFCWERYSLLASDVITLFEDVVLRSDKIDLEGTVVTILARDFLD